MPRYTHTVAGIEGRAVGRDDVQNYSKDVPRRWYEVAVVGAKESPTKMAAVATTVLG